MTLICHNEREEQLFFLLKKKIFSFLSFFSFLFLSFLFFSFANFIGCRLVVSMFQLREGVNCFLYNVKLVRNFMVTFK